jgi:signal transduction histidine kinase/sensor domain CHASE-containing protein
MSIRKRLIIITCLIFFAISASSFILSHTILLDQFKTIESSQVKNYVLNIENALNNYLNNQYLKLIDWANWDATYQYATDRNSEYVEANIPPGSIAQIDLDVMIFVDQKEQIVKAVRVDPDTIKEIPFPNSLIVYLRKNKDKILAKNIDSRSQGIIMLPEGVLLFTSKSILKSSGEGPIHGTLIFGKFFSKKTIDYLSDLTHLNVAVYGYNQKDVSSDLELAKDKLRNNSFFSNPLNNSTIGGYSLLKDQLGLPCLIIKVIAQRDVYEQGLKTLAVMGIMILSVVIILGVSFYILLEKLIISRITRVNSNVSEIKEKKDSRLRILLSDNNNDEITSLAKNINSMIDDLGQVRVQEEEERGQLELKIEEFERKNQELENSQKAIVNVLEDAKELEEELKTEKQNIEGKVLERTSQLQQEQARLQASISSLPVGFVMTDAKMNVVVMNGMAKSILSSNLESRPSGALTKDEIQNNDAINIDTIKERLKFSFDAKLAIDRVMTDRKPFEIKELALDDMFLHIFMAPITTMKEEEIAVIGSVMLIENITEQKILDRSKDEFFSIASHELRTPLTAIRGNTSMVLDYYGDQIKDQQMKEMINDVHESSIRLIEIVNDFLDTSRLELGKMEFKKDVFDLAELIPAVIKEYQVTGSKSNLYIHFENTEKEPAVIADKDRVRQVLINLIGNGLKFTEEGGITVSLKLEGNFVKVLVSDTGMGISEKSKNLLFRKFQQAENNIFTRDTTRGTGLGLYVSRMIMSGMGGKINLERSEVSKGTTFSFSLPVAAKAQADTVKANA